jgi:predicted membrane protein
MFAIDVLVGWLMVWHVMLSVDQFHGVGFPIDSVVNQRF